VEGSGGARGVAGALRWCGRDTPVPAAPQRGRRTRGATGLERTLTRGATGLERTLTRGATGLERTLTRGATGLERTSTRGSPGIAGRKRVPLPGHRPVRHATGAGTSPSAGPATETDVPNPSASRDRGLRAATHQDRVIRRVAMRPAPSTPPGRCTRRGSRPRHEVDRLGYYSRLAGRSSRCVVEMTGARTLVQRPTETG
jgi:hypothetical protein